MGTVWGGGTFSSSDGQRFPVDVKAKNARALPCCFGYCKGVTLYSWTSDQFSQYGTKVIPSTVRDATYVLDGTPDNETEPPLFEHTVDTSGFTGTVFALFAGLGMRFSPRIKDVADRILYGLALVTGEAPGAPRGALAWSLLSKRTDE
ncbi:Tn3 family transposase [Rubrobacter marinus]|uniref:Tn3 family transposase n=1 Tax=Rubrobacter marinus TaxID=2653852 RepID=A0A6G8PXH6_9ACTN|nr:Tn3 family transposase [Rubrobacter marinus]